MSQPEMKQLKKAPSSGQSRKSLDGKDNGGELPFFPKLESELICQEKLLVTWFEGNFSQAHYNRESNNNGSNACTLIVVLMSYYTAAENIQSTCPHNRINYDLVKALGVAMIKGNEIYNHLKREGRLPNVNLSIPEAIACAGKYAMNAREWKSVLSMQPLGSTLYTNLQRYLDEWCNSNHFKRHNFLFIVLICDSRSVLFIFNKKDASISLIDSHQHTSQKGAVIAIVSKENCRCLCTWLAHTILKYHHSQPNLYELSFLYFRRR